jgi:hypothetical protein
VVKPPGSLVSVLGISRLGYSRCKKWVGTDCLVPSQWLPEIDSWFIPWLLLVRIEYSSRGSMLYAGDPTALLAEIV